MAFRVVMVKFVEDVTAEQILKFREWLEDMAMKTPYLIRMECGSHVNNTMEQSLNKIAPSVSFHDFVSIWEFKDNSDIERFISEPFHHALAASEFKKIVTHRHVVNFT